MTFKESLTRLEEEITIRTLHIPFFRKVWCHPVTFKILHPIVNHRFNRLLRDIEKGAWD